MRMASGELGANSPNPTTVCKDQFPVGMRVLVVDDDHMTLVILDAMLRRCSYDVTTCGKATAALAMLREKKNFDLVISDVYMPDMDGFKLLELVGLEMDLPVIMMSTDGDYNNVHRGITHGACDYLLKPVRMEELRNIWQHVVRKRKNDAKEIEAVTPTDAEKQKQRVGEDVEQTSSVNSKKRMKEEDECGEHDSEDPSSLKKPRVVWSVELHQQFVNAVNQLNIDKAVPKKILELMDVPGLTRENVASHLQKYRLYLKRLSAQQPSNSMFGGSEGGSDGRSHGSFSLQPASVQQSVLSRMTTANGVGSSAMDQPTLLQLSGIQGSPPVFRPNLASPVFSSQSNYLPSFTGGYPDVSSYPGLVSQQPVLNVNQTKQLHHPGMNNLGGLSGGFGTSPNPLRFQLIQQKHQQHQQQQMFSQAVPQSMNLGMQQQQQQRPVLIPNEVNLGVSNEEIGFTGLGGLRTPVASVIRPTGSLGGGDNNLLCVVDSNFTPAANLPAVPLSFDTELKLPTVAANSSGLGMTYALNRNWQDLAVGGEVSPGTQSNFNIITQSVANVQQQQQRKMKRDDKSTADSTFKKLEGVSDPLMMNVKLGLPQIDEAVPSSDDILSFYLSKQQQEELGYVENDFDGFVADNICT